MGTSSVRQRPWVEARRGVEWRRLLWLLPPVLVLAVLVGSHRSLDPVGRHVFAEGPLGMGPVGVELEQVHPFQAITGHSDAAGAEVGPDGRTLYVVWEGYSRGCTRLAGVDIRALGDGRLAIRVAEGVPLLWQFSWSCSLAHHVRATRVTLDAPLPPRPVELVPFGRTAEA